MDSSIFEWLETARVDIKNQGPVENDVKISICGEAQVSVFKPAWFNKDCAGYVLETSEKELKLELECVGSGTMLLRLRGIDRRLPGGDRLPLWVDCMACFKNSHLMFKNPWKEQKTTPSCAA